MTITIGVLTVCVTSSQAKNKTCHLTFKRTTSYAIGSDSNPLNIAVGDFNKDNYTDLVVANLGTNNIGVLLGLGQGTFGDQVTYSTGIDSHPCSVVVADFNNDTILDIAAANPGTNSIGVFLGYGNGRFGNQITFSLGSSHPRSLAIGDFNNDNQSDIAVTNLGTSSVSILLSLNNGSFEIQVILDMGYDSIPYSLAAADFNNDKQLDIATVNIGTSELIISLSNGNGSFERSTYSTGTGSHPCFVVVGDFNDDKNQDIAVANTVTTNLYIFLGYGNGTFTKPIPYSLGSDSQPQFIVTGDFNNDGKLDIIVAILGNNEIFVLEGIGNGSFSGVRTKSTGFSSTPSSIAVGDFDNDNEPDIAITTYTTNTIVIFTSYVVYPNTSGTTYSTGKYSQPNSVAVGDLNNDKQLDIVVANSNSSSIGIFLGLGNGTFEEQKTYLL